MIIISFTYSKSERIMDQITVVSKTQTDYGFSITLSNGRVLSVIDKSLARFEEDTGKLVVFKEEQQRKKEEEEKSKLKLRENLIVEKNTELVSKEEAEEILKEFFSSEVEAEEDKKNLI